MNRVRALKAFFLNVSFAYEAKLLSFAQNFPPIYIPQILRQKVGTYYVLENIQLYYSAYSKNYGSS